MEPPTGPTDEPSQQRQRQRRVAERERKRAVRACDGCRRQKEKCDGGVPCRRCVRLRRQCEFLGPAVRPGETGISRDLPHSNDNTELTKRVKYMERLLQHYAGDINLDSDNLRGLAEAVDKDEPIPRGNDTASQGSEYLGADEENFSVQPLGNNITHYSGEFSHWNFSMRIKQWIEQCVPGTERGDDLNTLSFKEYYRAEDLQPPSDAFACLNSLPPRYVADFLVEAFFKHAETNYYYVERGWLEQKLDVVYSKAASLTRRDVGTVCLILIVLAIGTQYAYLDSSPNNPGHEPTGPFSEDALGIMFYQQASKLLPDVITVSSLESVQACLLIGVYALPLDASGLSYIYLNLAVKLAIQNGMHRKYPGEGLDPVIQETRNRVWWTAYTTERRVGIFHGRPISIASVDVDADKPVDRRDLWPSSSPSHIQSMLAILQLHQILGKISQEMQVLSLFQEFNSNVYRSVLKMHARHGAFDTLSRLVDLKNELHRWWNNLPESITPKGLSPSASLNRPVLHLKLEHCLVRMFVGRPFIFLGVPSRSNASSSSSPADAALPPPSRVGSSPRKNDSRSILVADCVDAALTVVDALKVLRNSIGLARGSYTEFSSCRAALLVIITQCLQGKTERLRQSLKDGVAMIKVMSSGGESAKSEASLIEVFERAIARLDAADDAPTGPESDYARFKKWEMLWKNDSPSTSNNSGGQTALRSQPDTPGPMPPPLTNLAGPWTDPTGFGGTGMTPTGANTPSAALGMMDWNFAAFPNTMDEFSSMFGQGMGPSPDSMGGTASGNTNLWMGS